jgi:hypothetical protein
MLLRAACGCGGETLPDLAQGLGTGLRACEQASAGGAAAEDVPAAPPPQRASHGGATGAGEQVEPEGRSHDRCGTGPV